MKADAVVVADAAVVVDEAHTGSCLCGEVNWIPISKKTRSGHCKFCGSYMFWDTCSFDTISILAGSIDNTQGLAVKGHIYTSEKAGYYDITDGLSQYDSYPLEGTL
jgi:hypothetical protein